MTAIPSHLVYIRDQLNYLAATHRTMHPDDVGFELRRLACATDEVAGRMQPRPVLSTRELEHAGVVPLRRLLGGGAA